MALDFLRRRQASLVEATRPGERKPIHFAGSICAGGNSNSIRRRFASVGYERLAAAWRPLKKSPLRTTRLRQWIVQTFILEHGNGNSIRRAICPWAAAGWRRLGDL
jgi:hypothetical protein